MGSRGGRLRGLFFLSCVLILGLVFPVWAQNPPASPSYTPGLGVEFFSRTIVWDEDLYSSSFQAYLFMATMDFEIRPGSHLDVLLGYGLSNFNGLVFRKLPFSIDYEAGSLGGILLGVGARQRVFQTASFSLEVKARCIRSFSSENEWAVPGLAEEGSLRGKPTWMEVAAGSTLAFRGLPYYVFPYLSVSFNTCWGTFRMIQTIDVLKGQEEKDIRSKSSLEIALGVLLEPTDYLGVSVEGRIFPYSGGLDFGLASRMTFSF